MTGQQSIFDIIPKPCDCGSTNLEDWKVLQGQGPNYLHNIRCKDCDRRSADRMGWISNAKSYYEAVKDWNEYERTESPWIRSVNG